MSSEIKIRNLEIADDIDLRKQEVKIGNAWIQTPIRTISPEKLYSKIEFIKDNGFVEIYKKLKPGEAQKIFDDKARQVEFSNGLHNLKVKGGFENPSFLLLEYESEVYPDEKEINSLARLSHMFSDIAPIPCIPKIVRKMKIEDLSKFLTYIREVIKILKKINSKPIMGYIPPQGDLFIKPLIDLYLDEGINAYYFDLDATLITSHIPQIDTIKRKLDDKGYIENHFIHFINAKYGSTAINGTNTVPAQDILGFLRGMDGFGGAHRGPKKSKEYLEWLKANKSFDENLIRIFDKSGYGYHRMASRNKDDILKIYPSDSIIPYENVDFSKKTVLSKVSSIINMQQHILESKNISQTVHEQPKSTLKYFESKRFLKGGILKNITRKSKK